VSYPGNLRHGVYKHHQCKYVYIKWKRASFTQMNASRHSSEYVMSHEQMCHVSISREGPAYIKWKCCHIKWKCC